MPRKPHGAVRLSVLRACRFLPSIFFVSSLLARPLCEINFCGPEVVVLPCLTAVGKLSSSFLGRFPRFKGLFLHFIFFSKIKFSFKITHKSADSEPQGSQTPLTLSLIVLLSSNEKMKEKTDLHVRTFGLHVY